MPEKETNLTFKQWHEAYIERNTINECSWFGIVIGLLLCSICGFKSLCTTDIDCVIYSILATIGLILFLIGGFAPLKLKKTSSFTKKTFSFIGHIILKLLILPVYFILTTINIFINRKYSEKFGFVKWNEAPTKTYGYHHYITSERKKKKNIVFDIMNSVFSVLAKNKMYVLIPIVVILMIFGLIMFFASSNAVFSFVYTLF